MFKDVPMKIVVPIIVVTWVLSLISSLAIVTVMPSLLGIKAGIDDGAVTSAKLASGAVITLKLADGNVTSAKILDGTITAVDVADNTIITAKIANGAVTTTKLGDASVATEKIADNAIVTIKLADNSVTSAKIVDGEVTGLDLATGTIITANIANGAVTTEKLADFSVTSLKLAAYAIPFNYTQRTELYSKNTAVWENVTGTSVTINVQRNSTLLIMFSGENEADDALGNVHWRVKVNGTLAKPGEIWNAGTQSSYIGAGSFIFYLNNVKPGRYLVYLEWYVSSTTGWTGRRSLFVIALPQ